MDKVRINKGELLDIVRSNLEKHQAEFEAAVSGYREKLTEELDKRLTRLRDEGLAVSDLDRQSRWSLQTLYQKFPAPESHTEEYERVIRMLELSVDDEIELTASSFEQLVMDEWGWKGAFAATNSRYS